MQVNQIENKSMLKYFPSKMIALLLGWGYSSMQNQINPYRMKKLQSTQHAHEDCWTLTYTNSLLLSYAQ